MIIINFFAIGTMTEIVYFYSKNTFFHSKTEYYSISAFFLSKKETGTLQKEMFLFLAVVDDVQINYSV